MDAQVGSRIATSRRALPPCRGGHWPLLLLLLLTSYAYLSGVARELPYYYEGDERLVVRMAVRMCALGDPNPHWFGNPGSTLLYPLAGIVHLNDVLRHDARLFAASRDLLLRFRADPTEPYLLARGLSAVYGVLGLLLAACIGCRWFSTRTGLVALWLALLCPIIMTHSQKARTDSAGLFFGLLALYLVARTWEDSAPRRQLLAGLALGLAVASRYFMIAVVVVWLLAQLFRIAREQSAPRRRRIALGLLAGSVAVLLAFLAITPFLLLDPQAAIESVRTEARTTHPGADGLSRPGNFLWYVTTVFPWRLGWPTTLLALAGLILVFWRGRAEQRIVALLPPVFLFGLSLSGLHWARWTIPILPLLALLAAHALQRGAHWLGPILRCRPGFLYWPALVLISIQPLTETAGLVVTRARPSTRLSARDWLLTSLPSGSRLVLDPESVPLFKRQWVLENERQLSAIRDRLPLDWEGKHFEVRLASQLSAGVATPRDYAREGFTHAVTSNLTYARVLSERARDPEAAAFYEALFRESRLLQRFAPTWWNGGPVVEIYELTP
jgi:hypothetical protein